MTEFLVFTLESRMASFGDLAGYERRGSGSWPGKSALMGLIGGALGIRRGEEERQAELRSLQFAVGAYDTGTPMRDFHTTQSVHQKIKRPGTRASALASGSKVGALNVSITLRDYRSGVLYGVAVWGGQYDLAALAQALRAPEFVPYLGRKSCPLSAPMAARVVKADGPASAINETVLPPWRLENGNGRRPGLQFMASDPHPTVQADSIEWRHDDFVNRRAWHFQTRPVHIVRERAK